MVTVMSSIFLRIYGGLLFTLVLVSLLSGIVISIVNNVRIEDYREQMVHSAFRLAAEAIKPVTAETREQWLRDQEVSQLIPFRVVPVAQTEFTKEELGTLGLDDVNIRMLNENAAMISTPIDAQWMLQGQVAEITEQMASASLLFLRQQLAASAEADHQSRLNYYRDTALAFPVTLTSIAATPLTLLQQRLLGQGAIVSVLDMQQSALRLFAQIDDNGHVLQLGPVPLLNLYPFKLTLTLGIFVLASISMAIYILVRGLETRLRRLERAATRFSQGDFEVRVPVLGMDSIGRLAIAFNAMADHIQHLLGLQKEMIRGVSHELRTPLARLRFGLDLVADATSDDERQTRLDGMDHDIQELDNLVDEFLTYAHLEQGLPKLNLKRHDVNKVVAQVVAEHLRQQGKISIEHIPCNVLNPRRFVEIDRRYMHRAIQNLVGNACRYADSQIQVRFSSTQNTCRIDVDDDGPGIPEADWERVFSVFSRLDDSRTRKSGGYGLGLSIVKRIMYWHGGLALVSNSPLGGARFSLVWPRKQPDRL